ncbi:MAG: hypothetical protein QG635_2303 [Bacteroidota bacterium]|nr:hypothetical protein [Bacteroidota bacterium]
MRFSIINIMFSGLLIVLLTFLCSCEDSAPTDYIPETVVEAFLLVGEPIREIRVMKSQPIQQEFDYNKSQITNARSVRIIQVQDTFNLVFAFSDSSGYFYSDTSYLVKSKTLYKLEITLDDGSFISGETMTPDISQWKHRYSDILYYPIDTVLLPTVDSIFAEWEKVPGIEYFVMSVRCLDTLEYGKYLIPSTDELNRRIGKPFSRDAAYYEISNWTVLPASRVPIFWSAFKWYGLHEFNVYVPDGNFLEWFIQYIARGQYDYRLASIKGAKGAFGSAAPIRDTAFVVKNQP